MRQHNQNNLNLYIRNIRLGNYNYEQLIDAFESIKGNKFDVIIGFINEFSKKDPLNADIVQFFKYIYNITIKMGRKNLEQKFKNYMPFNNICWNKIYDNNVSYHCEIINILHDFGLSIDTMNNTNEDAINSLCATINHKNTAHIYNNINNRMSLFNALMTPTENRLKSIINEILSKSVSSNIEYIKKIRWCLLINPYVTINKFITYFFALSNKNNKNEIYEEIVNYLCKAITGIDKIRTMKTLNNDIKLHISEKKSKYDIYMGQNNTRFLSEKELKEIIYNLLVEKGYDVYKNRNCDKFKSNENNKIGKLASNINGHQNLYDSMNKHGEIIISDNDMEFIMKGLNSIKSVSDQLTELEEMNNDEGQIEEQIEKYQDEYDKMALYLEDYVIGMVKHYYDDLNDIQLLLPIKCSYMMKLIKTQTLNNFTIHFNEILRKHILNEIIALNKSKQQIINNFDRNMEEYVSGLDNNAKVNGYILMSFLIHRGVFSQEEIKNIQSKFTQLCDGTSNDINIIYVCAKFVPNVKKHITNVFIKIAGLIKTETNTQKKFKMMDILESNFNIKITSDTDFNELETAINNTLANAEKKTEKVDYALLLKPNDAPTKPVLPIRTNNVPNNVPVKTTIKKVDFKKQLCKAIGLGEKCVYGKKCKYSHRIN